MYKTRVNHDLELISAFFVGFCLRVCGVGSGLHEQKRLPQQVRNSCYFY